MTQGTRLAWVLCAALLGAAAPARAEGLLEVAPDPSGDRPPNIGWAMGAGTLTALVPLAIGASLFASDYDIGHRRASSLVMAYGLALAPIVSHLVAREWSRAGIFGAIPLACAIGITVLVEVEPTVTFYGTRSGRWSYGLLLSFTTLSAGVGIVDTLAARSRWNERNKLRKLTRLPVVPSPFVTQGGGGLGLGGAF